MCVCVCILTEWAKCAQHTKILNIFDWQQQQDRETGEIVCERDTLSYIIWIDRLIAEFRWISINRMPLCAPCVNVTVWVVD